MENVKITRHDNSQEPEMSQCKTCGMSVDTGEKVCPFCEHDPYLVPLKY